MVQLIFVGKLDGSFGFLRESAAIKHGTNMLTDVIEMLNKNMYLQSILIWACLDLMN
jgi:hypothetical protein